MASEPLINLAELLAPIPGDDPAGEPVPFQVREDLEKLRKEVDPADFAPDDPARPTEAQKADWPKIVRLASDTLARTSKDMLVAVRLTEALTKQHGFAGLADGFALLGGLARECWDRMYPKLDPADPETLEDRAGPLNWLGTADRGALFPHAVRAIPLAAGANGPLAQRDWRAAQEGKGRTKEELDEAVRITPREQCQRTFDDATRAVEAFNALTQTLNERLGPAAPGLTDLRAAVGECYTLARQILQQKGPAADEAAAEEGGEAPAGANGAPARSAGGSRADAYRRLAEAADLLERLEPHSPIPYLVRRAVELGSLPFPLLMQALIRDDNVLTEMKRELGIKE